MWNKYEWSIFLVAVLLSSLFIKPSPTVYWNDGSRMAGIQAVVEQNTFIIDDTQFLWTGDKVFINGHFYSDKAALSYLIGVPVYSILYNWGINFENSPNLVYFLLTFFIISLSFGIMLVYFYKFLSRYKLNIKKKIFFTAALGFGTILFPYTAVFNNHLLTAAFLFLTFYALINSKTQLHYAGTGLLAGLTVSFETVTGPIFLLCFIGLLVYRKIAFTKLFCFIVSAAIPILLYFAINLSISGSIVPLQLNNEYFNYPGSLFNSGEKFKPVRYDSLSNWLNYVYDITFGRKGFFIYSPLMLFALAGLIITLTKKNAYRAETIAIAIGVFSAFTVYAIHTIDWGGSNFGFRHLIPLIPLLFMYAPALFQERDDFPVYALFVITFLFSVYINILGIINGPWMHTSISLDMPYGYIWDRLIDSLTIRF